jgi:hypothetical protein
MPWVQHQLDCSVDPDGNQQEFVEYLCDWPGCSKVANHVAGCVKELGGVVAFCDQHAMGRAA